MPTYEYECSDGHRFEVFQKMSDEPVAACPDCGSEARRVISGGAGFLFKGDGFYITDYRSDEYRKKASAEGPGDGGSTTAPSGSDSSGSAAASSSDGAGSSSSGDASKGSASQSTSGDAS